jgi:hypothetical protein
MNILLGAHYFMGQIGKLANVSLEAILLSDLLNGSVSTELLHACNVVVTTAEHQAVVAKMMHSKEKLAVVSTVPNLEAVIRLARLPEGADVGVVASSQQFVATLERLMARLNLMRPNFAVHDTTDRERLREFIRKQKIVVVTGMHENIVRQLATEDQEIIVFNYEIDQGSLNQLIAKLVVKE